MPPDHDPTERITVTEAVVERVAEALFLRAMKERGVGFTWPPGGRMEKDGSLIADNWRWSARDILAPFLTALETAQTERDQARAEVRAICEALDRIEEAQVDQDEDEYLVARSQLENLRATLRKDNPDAT